MADQLRDVRRALRAAGKETTLEVDGRAVHVANLDKILWPERGWTKADLIEYYIAVSPYMLPHLRNRPLVMVRYPDGIHEEHWFQKDAPAGRPEWVRTIRIRHHGEAHDLNYIVCDDPATLVWLAQMATVEIHAWSSTVEDVNRADVAVFDVDPQTNRFEDAVEGVQMVCGLLDELRLAYFLKTTGKRGLHVFVPLKPEGPYEDVRDFVHDAILLLDRRNPGAIALSYSKQKRHGRIFIDYAQNSYAKTNVAPYSLRATTDATASAPIAWDELKRVAPTDFRLDNFPRRLPRKGDLWGKLHEGARVTVGQARARLRALPS